MVSIPVALWTAFNALNCISVVTSSDESGKDHRATSFSLALGTAVLSCGLLSAGALSLFLGMEITLWILQMVVVLLALALKPPGATKEAENRLALSATLRLSLAMTAWLCV